MIKSCRAEAYAKINIGLEIGPRREDGYHALASIFQSVSLGDTLHFETTHTENELSVCGIENCLPEETTVFKAAAAWRNKTGIRDGLRIEVTKRIPAMGGMGGGSADAAATFMALERLFGFTSSLDELSALASRVGADVPFFLHGGAAFVSGVGDVIRPIKARTDYGILAVEPVFGISTAKAYAALDESRSGEGSPLQEPQDGEEWERRYRENISAWAFRNSFETLLEKEHPSYAFLRERLRETGARFAAITGSGSTIFGVYDSLEDARTALRDFGADKEGFEGVGIRGALRMHALEPLETSIVLR